MQEKVSDVSQDTKGLSLRLAGWKLNPIVSREISLTYLDYCLFKALCDSVVDVLLATYSISHELLQLELSQYQQKVNLQILGMNSTVLADGQLLMKFVKGK